MKHKLFASLVVLATAFGASAQQATPEAFVASMFNALKTKDSVAFVTNYPNKEQFKKFVRSIAEAQMKKLEVIAAMKADPNAANLNIDSLLNAQLATFDNPAVFGEMEKKYGENYTQVIQSGEKKGVNWSDAVLTGQTVDSATSDDMTEAGVKGIKGAIDFTSGGKEYRLRFSEAVYLPAEKGWFGGDFKDVLARRGDVELIDEEVSRDSLQNIQFEPLPKTKTKKRTPTAKTKTMARKPATKG